MGVKTIPYELDSAVSRREEAAITTYWTNAVYADVL